MTQKLDDLPNLDVAPVLEREYFGWRNFEIFAVRVRRIYFEL